MTNQIENTPEPGQAPRLMKCPHCSKEIPDKEIAAHLASKGGSVTGKTKARSPEQARAAVEARWAKVRKRKK